MPEMLPGAVSHRDIDSPVTAVILLCFCDRLANSLRLDTLHFSQNNWYYMPVPAYHTHL